MGGRGGITIIYNSGIGEEDRGVGGRVKLPYTHYVRLGAPQVFRGTPIRRMYMQRRSVLNEAATLRSFVVQALRRRDGSSCGVCRESISQGAQAVMQFIDIDGEIDIDNVHLIHRTCMFIRKIVERKPARASESADSQSPADKPQELFCSLHKAKRSEFYMANACKHFLCRGCENERHVKGQCPACEAEQQVNPAPDAS